MLDAHEVVHAAEGVITAKLCMLQNVDFNVGCSAFIVKGTWSMAKLLRQGVEYYYILERW